MIPVGLVDDADLLRLIDGEFITISKLEKEVGANKNVLRRRHERLKAKEKNINPSNKGLNIHTA